MINTQKSGYFGEKIAAVRHLLDRLALSRTTGPFPIESLISSLPNPKNCPAQLPLPSQ